MNEAVFDLPVPHDLSRVVSISDGKKWFNGIRMGTVEVRDDYITFVVRWSDRGNRRITLSLDCVAGYQVVE
jgi:hypothetical protein